MDVILTHEHTDFDALASLLAASKLYPEAVPVVPRKPNRNVRDFLTLYWDELPFTRADDLPREHVDGAVHVDTQGVVQLKGMDADTQIVFIDHHELDRDLGENMTYQGGDAGATTTLLVMELSQRGISLSPIQATLLLLGIYEDTGSLTYQTTTPDDAHAAAWLMEEGANLEVVDDFLHHPLTPQQRQLYDKLMENAEFHEFNGQTVLVASARAPDYVEEISTLAHKLRDLFEPAALFVLVRLNGHLQLVARSTTDAVDVADVVRDFNGGGHDRAAAALVQDGDLRRVRVELVERLRTAVKPIVTVADIMTRGSVHTLSPRASIAEASEVAQRYGHEGFPVVDDGQVVGVLTRREIDKALHHGLGGAAIETYMQKGDIGVRPTDSVERLQNVMMEHDVGQVPVIKDDQIVGIVTRTDLIKLWSAPRKPSHGAEIAQKMEAALPSERLELLHIAMRVADEMGYSLYVVGGFVRDLLLGETDSVDLDLVVEGNAIKLAKQLAEQEGGRAHGHSRFGTAKWIVDEDQALDFVTARTEFYEHPTALPRVERSSIKMDLHRRDFTINTMAICLDEDRYGQLLDFYGGERDLERGLIRVLHSLSFVEDPTRILRAVRLEQRLGFQIEGRTEELIDDASDLLDRVSGDRIRNELYLIFQEEEPERSLERLAKLGVLSSIHPGLRYDHWIEKKSRQLRRDLRRWVEIGCDDRRARDEQPASLDYLALLSYHLGEGEAEGLAERLKLTTDETEVLQHVVEIRKKRRRLQEVNLRPSQVYRALAAYSEDALGVAWIATDNDLVKERLALHHSELRCVEPELNGHDLKGMGLEPGPIYGEIVETLRDARLDGRVASKDEEKVLVRRTLEERQESVR